MIEKKRSIFGKVLFVLLSWQLLFTVLSILLPKYGILAFLQPYTVLQVFLALWLEQVWYFGFALAATSLLGWLLLSENHRLGRWLMLVPQWIVLTFAAILTPLHLLNEFGYINATGARFGSNLFGILLSGIPSLVYPIAVLILISKWKPHIK